jgi:diguanylate cyclase (GGDEF)-like protein
MTVGQIPAPGFRSADFSRRPVSSVPSAADTPIVSAARRPSTSLRVTAVSLVLVALGALLWALSDAQDMVQFAPGRTHLDWWMLALLAGVCEMVVLHIQVRREAHAISLSEIATVIGLFFATPTDFILGRAVGTLLAFVLWRRQSPVKVTFNAALFFAESALALLLFHTVRGSGTDLDPRAWLAAIVATVTAALLASLAVTAVIALVDREVHRRDFLIEPLRGALTSIFVTVVALVGVHALAQSPLAGGPLVIAMTLLLLGYRAYSALSERHLSLERLYRFSHAVSSTPEVDEILSGVLKHAREVLRAEYAEVIFVSSDSEHQPLRIDTAGVGGKLRRTRLSERDAAEDVWTSVISGGTPLLMPRGGRIGREFLAHRDLRDAVLVPLRGDAGIVGTVLVGDRMGEVRSFDLDDVQLLMTVANHASMALQNGRLVDRLRHDALHDGLTGLPNRTMLNQEMVQALGDVRAGRSPGVTVMIMDLVGFKQVNDTFGHQLGDLLLQVIGQRMSEVLNGRGLLARLGGDEFAAVLPRVDTIAGALDVAANVREALERPVGIEGVDVEVGVSIGVAVAPLHGLDGQTLMKRADAAMYDAKNSGSGLHIYEAGLESGDTPERLALTAELRAGISTGQLEVYVQPQASLRTGRVLGVEALVRWRHPRHGLLYPDSFIPLAERSGLIRQLTEEVLEQALAATGRWRREGIRLTMSVNLSARSNFSDELVTGVQSLLQRHGVPAEALTLEITESSVIKDPRRTGEVLDRLHALGVGLSLDDFGTGYSSMSYLRQLPVQEVKIDKSFVMAMLTSPEDAAIVRSVVDLGNNLGLVVVAEGVEDLATWEELERLGCENMQGFYLAAPMPLSDFEEWLAAREGRLVPVQRHH